MSGGSHNENLCTENNDRDLAPCNPTRYNTYYGVTKCMALKGGIVNIGKKTVNIEGFWPNKCNKSTEICCGGDAFGHYAFENGEGRGLNCVGNLVEPIKMERKCIRSNVYAVDATIIIKLGYNEIFYPRPDKGNEKQQTVSEQIYLHELGHQLDTRNTIRSYLQTLVRQYNIYVESIAPEEGLTFIERREIEIKGDATSWIKNVTSQWLDEIAELLYRKYASEIKHWSDRADLLYHRNYGKGGNPWDGEIINPLSDEEKKNAEKSLEGIKENLEQNNKDTNNKFATWGEYNITWSKL